VLLRHYPDRKPSSRAVERHARPHKNATPNQFTMGNARVA
jgi:hypothetical protein